ncbi:MAG: T9SS type A sorting domain-containing protein [Chitinophagales bacterium]
MIYPNPVQDKLNIALPRISKKIELRVYNILGRRVIAKEYSHQENIELNTEDLPSGIYILELEFATGKEVFKFIKE